MSAQIADATGSSGDLMFIELRGRDSRVVYLVRKATPIIELMVCDQRCGKLSYERAKWHSWPT